MLSKSSSALAAGRSLRMSAASSGSISSRMQAAFSGPPFLLQDVLRRPRALRPERHGAEVARPASQADGGAGIGGQVGHHIPREDPLLPIGAAQAGLRHPGGGPAGG